MTQEQKDLLIKDISGRLPYGVKCKILENNEAKILHSIQYDDDDMYKLFDFCDGYQLFLGEFKPYLFPLSSMTEEQKKEFDQLLELELKAINDEINHTQATEFEVDFYHKHHLDWRGLIPMGLAIDATGKNIY